MLFQSHAAFRNTGEDACTPIPYLSPSSILRLGIPHISGLHSPIFQAFSLHTQPTQNCWRRRCCSYNICPSSLNRMWGELGSRPTLLCQMWSRDSDLGLLSPLKECSKSYTMGHPAGRALSVSRVGAVPRSHSHAPCGPVTIQIVYTQISFNRRD